MTLLVQVSTNHTFTSLSIYDGEEALGGDLTHCLCDSGMLCGTAKKRKKKMMYLTTKNAGVDCKFLTHMRCSFGNIHCSYSLSIP